MSTLQLVLVTHDEKMLDVACDSVTLPGSEGYLGILPGHTPLISTLRPGELRYSSSGKEHVMALATGFCEVSGDVVTVLADSAETADQIDVEAARAAKAEAEQQMANADAEALEKLQERLDLAEARLLVAGA